MSTPERRTPMRRGISFAALVLALALLLLPLPAAAAPAVSAGGPTAAPTGAPTARKVLLMLMDRVSLADMLAAKAPNLHRLMAGGSNGLMNARVKLEEYGTGGYVLLGAGGRAIGGTNSGMSFNATEQLGTTSGRTMEAGDIYAARTGRKAPAGSVTNLFIEEMLKASDVYTATSTPGLLGQSLGDAGRRVAVVGNADSLTPAAFLAEENRPDYLQPVAEVPQTAPGAIPMVTLVHREAAIIAMDENGLVPAGDVSSDLAGRASPVTMLTTDFTRLVGESRAALAVSNLLVVDLGQTSRVDEQAQFFSKAALANARRKAIEQCDGALGELMASVDPQRDLVVLCAPTPTRAMIEAGDLLTPLVVSGPGYTLGGYLTSTTTRKDGLVTDLDVAPTVLQFLGVKVPAEMEGAALSAKGSGRPPAALVTLQKKDVFFSNARGTIQKIFVIPAMVILLLLLLITLVRRELAFRVPRFWSVLLLFLLWMPFVFLLLPLLPGRLLLYSILYAVLGSLLFAALSLYGFLWLAGRGGRADDAKAKLMWAVPRAMVLASALTLAGVLLDPFIGGPMVTLSPFGSGVLGGGRFYGVGNVYLGIALGAAILLACMVPDLAKRRLDTRWKVLLVSGAIMVVTVFVLGFPRLGANVGGLITGVIALLFVLIKLGGWKMGWKQWVAVALLVIICLGGLLLVDTLTPGATSHAGKAVSRISGSGISTAVTTIMRKIELNWKLFLSSIWRLFLLTAIIASLVWWKTDDIFKVAAEQFPRLSAAWQGMAVAIIAATVFKDTGVEVAGTIILYFIVPTLLLWLAAKCTLGVKARARSRDAAPEVAA